MKYTQYEILKMKTILLNLQKVVRETKDHHSFDLKISTMFDDDPELIYGAPRFWVDDNVVKSNPITPASIAGMEMLTAHFILDGEEEEPAAQFIVFQGKCHFYSSLVLQSRMALSKEIAREGGDHDSEFWEGVIALFINLVIYVINNVNDLI